MTKNVQPHPRTGPSGGSSGWWVFPVALLLVTLVLIVAAVLVQGPGEDTGKAGVGSSGGGQQVSAPSGGQR